MSSLTAPKRKIRVLSLFSGGGGLDLGFQQAGFEITFASDIEELFCETLIRNKGDFFDPHTTVLPADVTSLEIDQIPSNIDFIIGGPPCQTFSASGRRAGGAAGTQDKRGNLFEAYGKIIEATQPIGFLFENVRGILGANKGEDWKGIIQYFAKLGYQLDFRILDACDFGIPQHRERLILVGHRTNEEFCFPKPIFGPDSTSKRPHINLSETIKGVKSKEAKSDLLMSGGKYSHLLKEIPAGSNYLHFTERRGYKNPIFAYRSRFSDFLYKADPKTPTKTIIASPGKYTGPLHWKNRYFSLAEYKRIQGFPDNYKFAGNRAEQIKQIGNSVSPKIAYYLALSVAKQLFGVLNNVELINSSVHLSFDKRKGVKAQQTRAKHIKIRSQKQTNRIRKFSPKSYQSCVSPCSSTAGTINTKSTTTGDVTKITIQSDSTNKLFAEASMKVGKYGDSGFEHTVELKVYGSEDFSIQTLWNAFDDWIIRSSNYHSLFELYGHFTEPHPDFAINYFKSHTNHPIGKFAEFAADFKNCSTFFDRTQLTNMFSKEIRLDDFLDLVQYLRAFRFDVRCKEINIAIDKHKYMLTYPFSLPARKQMNFKAKVKNSEQVSSS